MGAKTTLIMIVINIMFYILQINLRGTLVSLIQLFDCFGYLIEYIVGSFVSYEVLIMVSGVLPLICFVLLLQIPESPYHLYNKGKESNAIAVLQYYRGHEVISKLQTDINELKVINLSFIKFVYNIQAQSGAEFAK